MKVGSEAFGPRDVGPYKLWHRGDDRKWRNTSRDTVGRFSK